jgi:hypothetical protein
MTCPTACTHPRATLPDGRETCTWSEDWRNHCEALHVCDMPTLVERRRYLLAIHNKRGEPAWLKLRTAVEQAWRARNVQPEVTDNTGS